MKAWIRDNYYMEKIPAKRVKDESLVHIFPVRDDPAEQIPSQRDDGIETILWHGNCYEVFSIDLQWENSDRISPHTPVGTKGYEAVRLALLAAEADIEGIIESGLVGSEHPVHQTLVEIQNVLAKNDMLAGWMDSYEIHKDEL